MPSSIYLSDLILHPVHAEAKLSANTLLSLLFIFITELVKMTYGLGSCLMPNSREKNNIFVLFAMSVTTGLKCI